MSKSIQRFEQLPPKLRKIQEENEVEFKIGDVFFYGKDVIRIREIKEEKGYKDEHRWQVYYDHATDWECTKWSSYGSDNFTRFSEKVKDGTYAKLEKSFKETMKEANDVLDGKINTDVYTKSGYEENMNEERAVIGRSSKEGLLAVQKMIDEKRQTALVIAKAIGFEMEKRKQALDVIRQKMYGAIAVFEKQIKKIMRVITTIELYLGIDEELHQIQSGEPASKEEPICFRQMVLYIDEEVGTHENDGLDFRNIEQFDEWLLKDNNIDIVLPEKKGVVVFNPRRYDKEYNNNYLNVYWNIENRCRTYILIRNGDNVYRIFTEKLVIKGRLFPGKKELMELMKDLEKAHFDSEKEKIEDATYQYRKRAILMQGLIDRTEVFYPLKYDKINLFKMEEIQDAVHFIYDDEMKIGSGRKSFNQWHEDLNKSIEHGSRILITSNSEGGRRNSDRYYYYSERDNYPPSPDMGIYEVLKYEGGTGKAWVDKGKAYEDLKKSDLFISDVGMSRGGQHIVIVKQPLKDENLTVLYNPGDEVQSVGWKWDPHERKQRVRYRIYRDDMFVLNYDQFELEDIEYYLKSRVDRENYLSMMPVLKEVKLFRLKELEQEKQFARLVCDRNHTIENVEVKVWDAISWWKFKNQWKRPIAKDDAKALRMIERKIKNLES